MTDARHIIAWMLALLCVSTGFSQADSLRKWQWKGFIKDMTGGYAFGCFDETAYSRLLHNRITLTSDLTSQLSVRVDVRNRIMSGSLMRKTPGWADAMDPKQGLIDMSFRWIDQRDVLFLSEIDRLQMTWSRETWDLTAGRQRINWGINNVWNPNDLFNTYNFLDFDYEERPGADALRFRYFGKEDKTFEVAWKPGKVSGEHVAALMYRFNHKGFDHQFMSGIFHRDLVVGMGWAGSIGETGFKGEWSYFHPIQRFTDTSGILSGSLMFDRTFPENQYASASIWYTNRPAGMGGSLLNSTMRLTPKTLFPYKFAMHAAYVKSFGSGFALTASIVFAPEKSTFIILPSLSREIDASWDVDLTVQTLLSNNVGACAMSGAAAFLRLKHSF
jgi:hypothetical protein